MDKQFSTSIVVVVLLFGFAISLSAHNYGKPYQPFRPYQRETAEVEPATMPAAQMSCNIGATSAYMLPTSLPQGDIYEPFTASAPSGATPRRTNGPGQGGTGETDTKNPALVTPIGDGIGFLLMMGLLYMMLKYVLKHIKNSTLLTKCHQMIE